MNRRNFLCLAGALPVAGVAAVLAGEDNLRPYQRWAVNTIKFSSGRYRKIMHFSPYAGKLHENLVQAHMLDIDRLALGRIAALEA